MIKPLENRFYYLDNFQEVIAWISARYRALLTDEELAFVESFPALPQASRALLVRMVMRKGNLFRTSKLSYEEIGCVHEAARPLLQSGWIDDRPELTLQQLFGLLTKAEIARAFRLRGPQPRKEELLVALREAFPDARPFEAWHPDGGDSVYQVRIDALCERFKLLFFGNCRQDWSEFVLANLGIYRYEKVEFSDSSLAFRARDDVDTYLHLHRCRERFEQGEPPGDVLAAIPASVLANDWLERRRQKLLFQIAQHLERCAELPAALELYSGCRFPGARLRAIRVLERCERFDDAHALAQAAVQAPESDAERPVHYVENTLINSLFGLLCWQAIFAPVPGAFFHPFHTGPADLHDADFHRRREHEFAQCLAQLDSGQYIDTINRNFADKRSIQSPFVFWEVLDDELKDLALACIPAAHLKKWFERILQDIQSNRAGLPDLIQFWPAEKRYCMIEVKGPGDRLQDNQIRWLDYCSAHGMPVAVCYVQWAEENA